MNHRFDYGEAFQRTLGWITPEEQARLRRARVAIADVQLAAARSG